jgi:hypothetical protein
MSTSDALALVNQAFLQLGEAAIDSFDGGSVPQQAAAATYQSTTDALLGGHPWWWNRKIVALTRLTDVPPVVSVPWMLAQDEWMRAPAGMVEVSVSCMMERSVPSLLESSPTRRWAKKLMGCPNKWANVSRRISTRADSPHRLNP